MVSFSKSEALSYGFETTKKNFKFFIFLLIFIFAINAVPSSLSTFFRQNHAPFLAFIASLVGWIFQMAASLGTIAIALKIHDGKQAEYKNLFDYFRLVIPYFLGTILYALIVLAGFILLIIPGIIWSIKFRYYSYFMVDKNMGPVDALKASAKITNGNKWNLFLLGLLLALINLLGLLALLVGLFITIPLSMMAEAWVFRKISSS